MPTMKISTTLGFDGDPVRFYGVLVVAGVDHDKAFSGPIEMSARIQPNQQVLAHMKFFGQTFPGAAIGELGQVPHVLHLGG